MTKIHPAELLSELFNRYKRVAKPDRNDPFYILNVQNTGAELEDPKNFFTSTIMIVNILQGIDHGSIEDLVKVPGLIQAAENYITKCVDGIVEDAAQSLLYLKDNQQVLHEAQAGLLKHLIGQEVSFNVSQEGSSVLGGSILRNVNNHIVHFSDYDVSPYKTEFELTIENPFYETVLDTIEAEKPVKKVGPDADIGDFFSAMLDGQGQRIEAEESIGNQATDIRIYASPKNILERYRRFKEMWESVGRLHRSLGGE